MDDAQTDISHSIWIRISYYGEKRIVKTHFRKWMHRIGSNIGPGFTLRFYFSPPGFP